MKEIADLLRRALVIGASDLFVTAGKPPAMRLCGHIQTDTGELPIAADAINIFRQTVLPQSSEHQYHQKGSFDASCSLSPTERFRLNFFETLSGPALAARPIFSGNDIFIDRINLPPLIRRIAEEPRGLILVAGTTGSGKSTTLAAMINHLNRTTHRHILTIEDPVEFIHRDDQSLISQREVNSDVLSFSEAMRSAMRENPDVIVVGEMRDMETMQTAINAALTGHLVISTVHTADTLQAIERIINLFPEHQREQVAIDLGLALVAIVAQRLLPAADGHGMLPAVECLLGTPPVKKFIADRDYQGLEDALRRGSESGMITFNRALFRLCRDRRITVEEALNASDNRDEFTLLLKGMESGVDAFRNHYGVDDLEDEHGVDMRQLLRAAVKMEASDLLLSCGAAPTLRINGDLHALDLPPLAAGDVQRLLFSLTSRRQRIEFEEKRELDFALAVELQLDRKSGQSSVHRFRVNGFYQRGNIGVVARVVAGAIPQPEELRLPEALVKLTEKQQGLVLVTGPTGSGKSTTLASLIDRINRRRNCHIITVEDPIEYVHENKLALIEQRELHADTLSFSAALKYALRQDPDVILVGEMRDIETMAAALTAAETGHLVFATIHTNNAPQTIDRIVDSFPAAHQNQIRLQLAGVLLAAVSQRLLTRVDGKGRIAAFEVMTGTPPVQALIREGKTHQLQSVIETGAKDGMITMEKALDELYHAGQVSIDEVRSLKLDTKEVKSF